MAGTSERGEFASLNDLRDYEVADGEPDPRGWDVFASDGVRVGRIEDLLVDTDQMRVRAIECHIDNQALNLPQGEDRLYIPIRSVSLDESAHRAVVPDLRSDQVESLRGRSSLESLKTGTQTSTRASTDRTTGRDMEARESGRARPGGGEVHVPLSEEELDVSKRSVRAGEVDVHTRVETEHVSRPVNVRHEEVDIERRPVAGQRGAGAGADFEEREIRIPVTEEELVVDKHPVVREEIVLRKRAVDEERRAEADLRRERVNIETKGDAHTHEESERGRRR